MLTLVPRYRFANALPRIFARGLFITFLVVAFLSFMGLKVEVTP
jgi:hypothetical protein